MVCTVVDDEQVYDVTESWEELLYWSEDYINDVGEFNHDAFKKTMLMTWKLFAQRIDFEVSDDSYSLPIDLACILGEIMEYSDRRQICLRQDGGDISLSAMIVEALWNSIRYRDHYSRDKAVIDFKKSINRKMYRLVYDIESDVLHVHSGSEPEIADVSFDLETGDITKVDENVMEPIIVDDIAYWWLDTEDESKFSTFAVLNPDSLVEKIREEAQKVMEVYK